MQPILNSNISAKFSVKYNCNISKSKLVFPLSNESYFGLIGFTRLEVIKKETGVHFFGTPGTINKLQQSCDDFGCLLRSRVKIVNDNRKPLSILW